MTIFGVCDMLRLTTRIRGWSPTPFELFSTAENKEEIMQTTKSRRALSTGWTFIILIFLAFMTAPINAADKEVTFEGTIQGLNCT
jgi:hypothetical protein